MPTTLAELYRRQLEAADPEVPRTPPPGWLLSTGVADVVEPFITRMPDDGADLARFAGLGATAAAELLRLLPPGELDDRQNWAPTLGTILRSAVAHPGLVEVHGYLVGPARADERLTAEGVVVRAWLDLDVTSTHEDGCQCGVLIDRVRDELGIADDEQPPDEVRPLFEGSAGSAAGTPTGWVLWWD